jgi:ribosomal subunit interface protein
METPLQIVLRNVPHSDALDARVRENVAKLEEFHPRIVSCRVTIEESRKHRRQGRQFQVRIDTRVPGKEIVASHSHDEDVYLALRDAVAATRRQLEDAVRMARGDVKAHEAAKQEDSQEPE